MEKSRYCNKEMFKAWIRSGVKSPEDIKARMGVSIPDAYSYYEGKVLPPAEVIGRTVEMVGETYDEGASSFLQPWADALRMDERGRLISNRTTGERNPNFGRRGPKHPMFGWVPTEEERRQMSERMQGSKNPQFGKKGLQHPAYGRRNTSEQRDHISAGRFNPEIIHPENTALFAYIFLSAKTVNKTKISDMLQISFSHLRSVATGRRSVTRRFIENVLSTFPPQDQQDLEKIRTIITPNNMRKNKSY